MNVLLRKMVCGSAKGKDIKPNTPNQTELKNEDEKANSKKICPWWAKRIQEGVGWQGGTNYNPYSERGNLGG